MLRQIRRYRKKISAWPHFCVESKNVQYLQAESSGGYQGGRVGGRRNEGLLVTGYKLQL